MWKTFLSSLFKLSRMIKFFWGLSTPTISTIWFLYAILNGKIYLQISQSTLLNLSMTWPLCTFLYRFVSSHDLRHLRWMVPWVPMHLQGEIRGFGSSSSASGLFSRSSASVPQQILQTASSDYSVKFVGLLPPTWSPSSVISILLPLASTLTDNACFFYADLCFFLSSASWSCIRPCTSAAAWFCACSISLISLISIAPILSKSS